MVLYLTLILKYWQYIVIALCSIVIVALLIRCNILDERNTSLKKEHELQLNTVVITNQAKTIELLKQQNETEAEKLLASIDTFLLNQLGITLPKHEENTLKSRMFTTSLKELSSARFDPNYHTKYYKELFKSFEDGKYEYSTKEGSI